MIDYVNANVDSYTVQSIHVEVYNSLRLFLKYLLPGPNCGKELPTLSRLSIT